MNKLKLMSKIELIVYAKTGGKHSDNNYNKNKQQAKNRKKYITPELTPIQTNIYIYFQ